MSKHTFILVVAGALVVVLGLVLISRGPDGARQSGAERAPVAGHSSSGAVRQAPPPVTKDELLASYGESQVARAEALLSPLGDLLGVIITVEEDKLNGSAAGPRLRRELAHPVLASLDLDERQRARLVELLDENQRWRVAAMRDAAERLRAAPEPMLAFILAGDALRQGLISTEEFVRVRDASAFRFESLVTPNASLPLANPRFLAELEGLLTAEQRERFQERLLATTDPSLAPPPFEDQAMSLEDYAENIGFLRKIYESSGREPDPGDGADFSGESFPAPGELMPPEP